MSWWEAYLGAVGNYFSVWIFCLMQIIPFFIAIIVGGATNDKGSGGGMLGRAALVALLSFGGFSLTFVGLGMTGEPVARFLFRYASLFTQLGAVAIGLTGLTVAQLFTLPDDRRGRLANGALAVFFGIGVAFAYKPCVSPVLTAIYRIASDETTAYTGGALLLWYAAGIATITSLVGVGLSWGIEKAGSPRLNGGIRILSAGVIVILALVIMTDNMTAYKRFLVGRFAPEVAEGAP